ncbi:MAG: butyrate kinase [Oscillospiraceae bacterium]
MEKYKIFVLNPGSTSTKVAMYENEDEIFNIKVTHDANKLAEFPNISDQYEYRYETIMQVLKEQGQSLDGISAVSTRGGSVCPLEGGVYPITDLLVADAMSGKYPKHPAQLGPAIAQKIGKQYNVPAFTVNPPDVDEFDDVARVTGLSTIFRSSHAHALNQKETAIRVAKDLGKRYEDCNFVVAHLGGGVSITAHRKGKAVDTTDVIDGEGPMAPTRAGTLPAVALIRECYSGKYTYDQMYSRITKNGGFVSHLGTSEVLDVVEMVKSGDTYAKLIYDAFVYQVGKSIASMAAVLEGKVDAIILTGGITHNKDAIDRIEKMVSFCGPVIRRPGEFEMEALAAGAIRVLTGEEQPKTYTGVPVWQGFDTCGHTEKI